MTDLITRKDAISLGLKKYFTGKQCPHGHTSERWVSSYGCVDCQEESKAAYRANPEFRERELSYKAEYRAKNRDKVNEYAKWYWRHHPNAKAVSRRTKNKNRSKTNERQRVENMTPQQVENQKNSRRRTYLKYREDRLHRAKVGGSKRRGASGNISKSYVEFCLAVQDHKCVCCGSDISDDYEIDHIVPISKGGSNYDWNIQCLCKRCNIQKSNKCPVEWALSNGIFNELSHYVAAISAHGAPKNDQ